MRQTLSLVLLTLPLASHAADPAPAAPSLPAPIVVADAGLATPESVLHDTADDVYLVSNINGAPLDADDNGFISRISPEGKVVDLKWIDGASEKVTLSAPKGMAIVKDTLYVTDITAIRMFDRKTGEPKGEIPVEGASFLNDLAAAPDGTVLVSDSGLKAGEKGFEPSGTDAIYKIGADNKAVKIAGADAVKNPNGLWTDGKEIVAVAFSPEKKTNRLDMSGKLISTAPFPANNLDGVEKLNDGSFAISSWETSAVYREAKPGEAAVLVAEVTSPADIGYDAGRNRILIPVFMQNKLVIQPLE